MINKNMKLRVSLSILTLATLTNCTKTDTKFKQLSASETGILFVNEVRETKELNILDYLYYYNGGGVAAGDLNGDGLSDVYFVSTQGENKMYLNKTTAGGAIKFEDKTKEAGVGGSANWQTGVTMADVNGDGKLDIYVCAVGNYKSLKGHNELYINVGNDANGVPKFEEKATEYGLDFKGFSTQAAFIDYDKDGDLDMYLLNHATHNVSSYDKVSARALVDSSAGDVLYRNDGPPAPDGGVKKTLPHRGLGGFTNVSTQAKIYQAAMGYGLGISVADFNNDGWDDIYVSNDFHEDDYYYINNTDGTFTESVKDNFRHLSKYSMGCDAADMNNDGWLDIFTADMLPNDERIEKSSLGEDALDIFMYKLQFGFYNQYSHNALHLNLQGQKFAEISLITGTSATDWSWSPLLADFDNDGRKDLFVANGIPRRPNDLDYIKYINRDSTFNNLSGSPIYGNKEQDIEAIQKMPDGAVHNYIFRGSDSLKFEDKSTDWGFDAKTVSNGALYADLDNDGDLEIITNDLNQPAGIFQNMTREKDPTANYLRVKLTGNNANTAGFGAKVYIKYKNQLQTNTMQPTRGFESASEPVVHFGLNTIQNIDSLIVVWPSGLSEIRKNIKTNQLLTLKQSDAKEKYSPFSIQHSTLFTDVTDKTTFDYKHTETSYLDMIREPMMPFQQSTQGPASAVGDVNGDGRDDVFVGGARDQAAQIMIQRPNGSFEATNQPLMLADAACEDVDAVFFDADGDKDLDLYVVSGGNEFLADMVELRDRLYLNDGKGKFTKTSNALPIMNVNKSCVVPADFDQDGDIDLFVGGRVVAYQYGITPQSFLLVNDGKGHFTDRTNQLAPNLKSVGMVTDAVWTDLDNDKDLDLAVVGDWLGIEIFENNNKSLSRSTTQPLSNKKGFWQTIEAADFDHDGDDDLLVGNLGLNTKFVKGKDSELKMYVKDIDGNGIMDQLIGYKRDNEYYPLLTKDELGKQMPGIINKRFTKYKDFAGQPLDKVITPTERKGAVERTVNTFESVYIENKGKMNFETRALPLEAQFSKIFAFSVGDFDKDSHLDALVAGNLYGVSTYQGRYDASFGWFLKGDGKGHFKAQWPAQSGFMVDGEARNIKKLTIGKKPVTMVTLNNKSVRFFE